VIAEDGIKAFPFDVNRVLIRQYHHLGEDIGFEEAMRFRGQLTSAIMEIMNKNPRDSDSPVYTYLNGLTPPALAGAIQGQGQNEKNSDKVQEKIINTEKSYDIAKETHSALMQQVDEAQKRGDWIAAKTLLTAIRKMMMQEKAGQNEDPYILQRLALITYKSKFPNEKDALTEAHELLNLLEPGTSNDTETLGLWGAIHKRLAELTEDPAYLDEAIRAYERGFYIRNDHYNGINYAFLLNVRAGQATDKAEAIADYVEARRVRKEVISICEVWLKNNPIPDKDMNTGKKQTEYHYHNNWYWVKATMGEAYVGIGDEEKAQQELKDAYENAPEKWMKQSTEEQLAKLKPLLGDSPLKYIV
jgi:hypothetical protein